MFAQRSTWSLGSGVVITAAVLLCSACGGSSGKSAAAPATSAGSTATSTSATTSAAAPTTSAPAAVAPTAAKLKSFNLAQADLGTTWKSTPADPSDKDDPAEDAELAACIGSKNTDADKVSETASPDFALANATISSSATSYKSQADIDSDVATNSNPKTNACFDKTLRVTLAKSLPAGTTLKSLNFKIVPGSGSGPSNVVATETGSFTVVTKGQTTTVYEDSALITGPLTEAEVDFENVGAPVPAAEQARLTKIVADRVAKG